MLPASILPVTSDYEEYKDMVQSLICDYKVKPSNKLASAIARCFLDNQQIELSYRAKLLSDFISYLEANKDLQLAVKMTKHLISQGAYKLALETLNLQVSKFPESQFAVNELKNIYFREAINFWRTGETLYGVDGHEDLYSATSQFIRFIKNNRNVLSFSDFGLISQVTTAFLILSTNEKKVKTAYVDDLLSFAAELHEDGKLTVEVLNLIYHDVYTWFGHFSIANYHRQEAVNQFLNDRELTLDNALQILLSYAEQGLEIHEVRYNEIIRILKSKLTKNQLSGVIKYYKLNSSSEYVSAAPSKINEGFGSFISGKSVAIVGPFNDGMIDGDEIDSYDVVIRINNHISISNEDKGYIGSKTDVVYFIHQMLSSMNSPEPLESVKFVRLRNGFGGLLTSCYSDLIKDGKISQSSTIPRQFYKGASAIQTIIFDILDFNPSRIKLFKMNFYLDSALYSDSYKKNTSVLRTGKIQSSDLESYRSVFFAHDFAPQFLFVKNLYENGRIEVSDYIASILNLSLPAYMKAMELSHKVPDSDFMTIARYIQESYVTKPNNKIGDVSGNAKSWLKIIKSYLRVFDFSNAYHSLQELKKYHSTSPIVVKAQKLYDLNWLAVDTLFQRNWCKKLSSPRQLHWSDINKIYNIESFDASEKLIWFFQTLDYQDLISKENRDKFILNNLNTIIDLVGELNSLACILDGSSDKNIFRYESVNVKQAFARYDLMQWLGKFQAAHAYRKEAIDMLKNEQMEVAALAQVEEMNNKNIHYILTPTGNLAFDSLLNGSLEQFHQHSEQIRAVNLPLKNLIKGKTVAIVGPAPTGELSGSEIDSYDVVIRFNYTGASYSAEFGTKINISAYNKVNSIYFEKCNVPVPFNDLDFYFVKEPVVSFKTHAENAGKIGVLPRIPFMLHKSPMATLDILYFILMFKPREIKIFKHTLLLSANTHSESYGHRKDFDSGKLTSLQKLRMTLSGHDLLSHHSLFRHFYSLGLFKADTAFDRILNLSSESFSDELQRIYGL